MLIRLLLVLVSFVVTSMTFADGMTKQIPHSIQCIQVGAGQGKCRVYMPEVFNACQYQNAVGFDPNNDPVGKQAYSMILAAISAQREVEISYFDDTCPLNSAKLDWIRYH